MYSSIKLFLTAVVLATGGLATYDYGKSGGSPVVAPAPGAPSSTSCGPNHSTPAPVASPPSPGSYGSSSSTPWGSSSSTCPAGSFGGTTSPGSNAKVQIVKVSNENVELKFFPETITAEVGSFVQFQFYPKNHSVVQSSFDRPCVPVKESSPEITGFFSGFMPVADNAQEFPVYTIKVENNKPIWFYCSQGKHCQGGMAGVINPPADGEKTLAKYIEAAKNAPENKSPAPGSSDCAPGGSPSGPAPGGSPSSPSTGGYPLTPRPGGSPSSPSTGGSPGGSPSSPSTGGSPLAPRPGVSAPGPSTGGSPLAPRPDVSAPGPSTSGSPTVPRPGGSVPYPGGSPTIPRPGGSTGSPWGAGSTGSPYGGGYASPTGSVGGKPRGPGYAYPSGYAFPSGYAYPSGVPNRPWSTGTSTPTRGSPSAPTQPPSSPKPNAPIEQTINSAPGLIGAARATLAGTCVVGLAIILAW